MTEILNHECGIALIRLRKPLSYYKQKYGSWTYGIQRLYLLMEKQHNRGQDGAGVAALKLNTPVGIPYIDRTRSNSQASIRAVFDTINQSLSILDKYPEAGEEWIKANVPFLAELYLGHLRYRTNSDLSIDRVHPVLRSSNWKSRNLVLAGNFNLTNANEIFEQLVEIGQHPRDFSDTVTILEKIGYFLDKENETIYKELREKESDKNAIAKEVAKRINIHNILQKAIHRFDGGYVIGGLIGNGDAFVIRDPHGIRPAFYYVDEEIAMVASERPVIQTALRVQTSTVEELMPGEAIIIKNDGNCSVEQILPSGKRAACSFERIYFSRGTDKYIYRERKQLGEQLVPQILKAINYDLDNTIFSHIPNTAETAFFGMVKGIEDFMLEDKKRQILSLKDELNDEKLHGIISKRLRAEKIAVKDVKLRTFITEDEARNDMVEHVYDVTYGVVRRGIDSLVIIDDSIVRGTTLRQSILKMLDRLDPKKIVVVSSAPQIRYPDCYGIEMTHLSEFCAFLAAIELLKESNQTRIIEEVYRKCKVQEGISDNELVNHVKEIYRPFTPEQIAAKIAVMLRPEGMNAEVELVFQSLEGLHAACPDNNGDWYFSGNYPTLGGFKVVNKAFINYYEKGV
ncbi:MAG: amidophosphoribosyltransferase [Bacteroidales bacterium]|nr:amidophosphoribosyltransferase [Bacteroidales bacterium]MCL2132897.1 amidophosphoribosyltransferase [Bacteroidales bacterium]